MSGPHGDPTDPVPATPGQPEPHADRLFLDRDGQPCLFWGRWATLGELHAEMARLEGDIALMASVHPEYLEDA